MPGEKFGRSSLVFSIVMRSFQNKNKKKTSKQAVFCKLLSNNIYGFETNFLFGGLTK